MVLVDVANKLKEDFGYEDVPTSELVDVARDTFTAIRELLISEGQDAAVRVPKFGNFVLLISNARIGFNPKTKEKINIPEKVTIKFRVSKEFKDRVGEIKIKKTKSSSKKKKKTNKKK